MRRFLPLTFLLATLSCGDAGSSGLADSGGIGGTGISTGPITAFGSIFVTGTRWDIGDADVTFDGDAGDADDLRLGMVVTVRGDRMGDDGDALSVDFDDAIEGPVSGLTVVDLDTTMLTILDQSVTVTRSGTVFEDTEFDSLMVNRLVEVSGFRNAAGDIFATRLEDEGPYTPNVSTPEVELRGTVTNSMAGSFTIGAITIVFSGGGVSNGDFVEVEGVLRTDGVTVDADEVEQEDPFSDDDDTDDFEIEGLVSGFTSLSSTFEVAGVPVDASGSGVEFEPSDPSWLADGVRVEVDGSFEGGVLMAEEVKQNESEAEIEAAVVSLSDVDPIARTVVLLGATVHVPVGAKIEDDRDGVDPYDPFAPTAVAAGDFFQVKGFTDGTGRVVATEFEREDEGDVKVSGQMETFDGTARTVTLLGVVVPTNAMTAFGGFPGTVTDEASFYAFLASNPGVVLDAKDSDDGNAMEFDFADEMELED